MSEPGLDFTTPEISDALLRFGFPNGGLMPDIHLHSPAPPNANFCISGPAYTVRMVGAEDQTAPELSTHFLDTAPPKSIIVIDAPAHAKNAVWDSLTTAGAQTKGVAGVVVSGRVRDVAQHCAAGFPVFARGRSTVGQSPFIRLSAVGVPLVIQPPSNPEVPFAAVRVETGDWIFADENGVVRVPIGLLDKVMEAARVARRAEALAIQDIRAGKGVLASLTLHGAIKPDLKEILNPN